jgi:hypothetical protein
MSHNSTHPSS